MAVPQPEPLELREGTGEPRTERGKREKAAGERRGAGRQGAWSSCPHLPQELEGAESAVALEVRDSQGMGREEARVCLSSHLPRQ